MQLMLYRCQILILDLMLYTLFHEIQEHNFQAYWKAENGMEWNERQFLYILCWQFSSIPFPLHTKNLPFHTKIFFFITFHIKVSLDRKLRVICILLLQR